MKKIKSAIVVGAVSLFAAALASPAYASPASAAQPARVRADWCSLHVSVAHPVPWQKETLTVATSAGRSTVEVQIWYKTVSHTWVLTTPRDGWTTYRFGVGKPTPGYRVALKGTVLIAPRGYRAGATCSTSFVPR